MRFASIDFARLTPPTAIDPLNYEAIFNERRTRFLELWEAARRRNPALPSYDTLTLESDPIAVLLQENAYRELVLRQLVNDRTLSVMLPYAQGPGLDALGSLFGIERFEGETDARFRRRAQLAPEAFSAAGAPGAYLYHALTAAPTILDASVASPRPGYVRVTLMGGGEDRKPTAAELAAVRTRLVRPDVKPLTDMVSVVQPSIRAIEVSAVVTVPSGPGVDPIRTRGVAALSAYLNGQSRLGATIAGSGIAAALHQPGVLSVDVRSPVQDISLDAATCFRIRSREVTYQVAVE